MDRVPTRASGFFFPRAEVAIYADGDTGKADFEKFVAFFGAISVVAIYRLHGTIVSCVSGRPNALQ